MGKKAKKIAEPVVEEEEEVESVQSSAEEATNEDQYEDESANGDEGQGTDEEEGNEGSDEEEYDINGEYADDNVDGEVEVAEEEETEEEKHRLRKEAAAYREALDKRGVIYLSRVPPFMKPNKVRTLLEPYGEITRLFLAEEDAEARKKRKEYGGNSSRQFKEGWVEFSDKKVAKNVAESLNNTHIGGRKGDYYHDDTWNLKYLRKFKWEYLTEKFAYERRVRENKLKTAMMQAKKNNAEIADLIEKTKVQQAIAKKRARAGKGVVAEGSEQPASKRKFHQRALFESNVGDSRLPSNVMQHIFPNKAK